MWAKNWKTHNEITRSASKQKQIPEQIPINGRNKKSRVRRRKEDNKNKEHIISTIEKAKPRKGFQPQLFYKNTT